MGQHHGPAVWSLETIANQLSPHGHRVFEERTSEGSYFDTEQDKISKKVTRT